MAQQQDHNQQIINQMTSDYSNNLGVRDKVIAELKIVLNESQAENKRLRDEISALKANKNKKVGK